MKAKVRKRDGFKCVVCGMTNEQHLERYKCQLDVNRTEPGSAYTLDGCETLCRRCHGKKPRRPPGSLKEELASVGLTRFFTEVTTELMIEYRAWLAKRGESVRDMQEWMMRQVLAQPPPPGTVPAVAVRKPGRPKKDESATPKRKPKPPKQ